jgi:hypothetical protein
MKAFPPQIRAARRSIQQVNLCLIGPHGYFFIVPWQLWFFDSCSFFEITCFCTDFFSFFTSTTELSSLYSAMPYLYAVLFLAFLNLSLAQPNLPLTTRDIPQNLSPALNVFVLFSIRRSLLNRNRTTVQLIESRNVINRISVTYVGQIWLIWKFFLDSMKITMNTFLFFTHGFICFIFCLSMLLIKAFNYVGFKWSA